MKVSPGQAVPAAQFTHAGLWFGFCDLWFRVKGRAQREVTRARVPAGGCLIYIYMYIYIYVYIYIYIYIYIWLSLSLSGLANMEPLVLCSDLYPIPRK